MYYWPSGRFLTDKKMCMHAVFKWKVFKVGVFFMFFVAMGCEKFVTPDAPTTSVNEENVYKTDATAIAVLTGIYTQMVNNSLFTGRGSISLLSGLSADELTLANTVADNSLIAYYKNALRTGPAENYGIELW